jgi:hypothetical protein
MGSGAISQSSHTFTSPQHPGAHPKGSPSNQCLWSALGLLTLTEAVKRSETEDSRLQMNSHLGIATIPALEGHVHEARR